MEGDSNRKEENRRKGYEIGAGKLEAQRREGEGEIRGCFWVADK